MTNPLRINKGMIDLPGNKRIATRSDLENRLILEDMTRSQDAITEKPTIAGLMNLLICAGDGETPETNAGLNYICHAVKRLGINLGDADTKALETIEDLKSGVSVLENEVDTLKIDLQAAKDANAEQGNTPPVVLSMAAGENHAVWLAGGDRSYSPHNMPWDKLSPEAKDQIAMTVRNSYRYAGVAFEDDLCITE